MVIFSLIVVDPDVVLQVQIWFNLTYVLDLGIFLLKNNFYFKEIYVIIEVKIYKMICSSIITFYEIK